MILSWSGLNEGMSELDPMRKMKKWTGRRNMVSLVGGEVGEEGPVEVWGVEVLEVEVELGRGMVRWMVMLLQELRRGVGRHC